jgi:hypothetical protein
MNKIDKLLPYIKLLYNGEILSSTSTKSIAEKCLKLRWAQLTRRSNIIALTDLGRESIPTFLTNQWPEWKEYSDTVLASGQALSVDGIRLFEQQKKTAGLVLPNMIHHKTFASICGKHSKAGISKSLGKIAEEGLITTDQILRLWANKGLVVSYGEGENLSCDKIMKAFGEVAIPERAFINGFNLEGTLPKVIMTVENRGSYVDFPVRDDSLMLINCPGDDTSLVIRFLNLLPPEIPCYHFGDIDPKGLAIAERLTKSLKQRISLFIPSFWQEYVGELYTRTKEWNSWKFSDNVSKIVRKLANEGKWLEQERIMLDNRLATELNNTICDILSSL